jgi:STE24 endopeptidase
MSLTGILASNLAAASAAFDPELATRAYLNTLQGTARARSDAYFEGGYWLPLWGTAIGVLVYWLMLRFRWSAKWGSWASRVTRRTWLQPALYSMPFTIVGAVLTFPWTLYTGFLREKQYGLMNQSFGGWFGEFAISFAISLVITAIFFVIVFAVIRNARRSWWAWASLATIALMAVSIMVAPVFIAPLFNKYTPMAEGPMREQILGMAHAQGIPADNVYVFDASKQSDRISANVSGLGPTIRISLNDNLLKRSTPEGVKAVMGHEMGHYVLGHIFKLLIWFALIAVAAFLLLWWISPRILERRGAAWGVRSVADPAVAPLFAIILSLFFLVMTPVLNSIVRHSESEADAFGLDAAREPDGFAMTAMQLSQYRKIEPGKLEEMLFFDHPSGRTRVRMAMDWKAKHLNELPPGQRGMFVMQPPPAKP